MKLNIRIGFPIILISLICIIFLPFQACEPDDDNDDGSEFEDSSNVVRKPNLYIYPVEKINLNLNLLFPQSGEVITSIPKYNDGWIFSVDTNGIINGIYDYLFYESIQPDVWQREYAWIIESDQLEIFFRENLTAYGFYGREIQDFIDYWIPRLKDYNSYIIFPQEKDLINTVIELDFSIKPDNIQRLFYKIEGLSEQKIIKVETPVIDPGFVREGFFVTEWGVILD